MTGRKKMISTLFLKLKRTKIVRFKDGSFGIRKGWFFYRYLDLSILGIWWKGGSTYFEDCKIKSEPKIMEIYYSLKDTGKAVMEKRNHGLGETKFLS